MIFALFLALIALPIIEIMVIVYAGGAIGWLNVILLTIGTAALGTVIIRAQGLSAIQRIQEDMRDGQMPVGPAVDGAFLLVAAPFLMTPGFITDGIGFLLLVPPVRMVIGRYILRRLQKGMENGTITIIRR